MRFTLLPGLYSRSVFALLALMLILSPVQAADTPDLPENAVVVSLSAKNNECMVKLADEQLATDQFAERLAAIKDKSRPVIITADESVPYRCVSGVIYLIQKAGFIKIGFASEGSADKSDGEAMGRDSACSFPKHID